MTTGWDGESIEVMVAARRYVGRVCGLCHTHFISKRSYVNAGRARYCSRSCGTRRYTVNEHYFDRIETDEAAYWLGFLFSDGYQDGDEVKVELAAKDRGHLELLRVALNAEHPVKDRPPRPNSGAASVLLVGSRRMCVALSRWGCVPSKTMTAQWPQGLAAELEGAFLRGIFDGDGCISRRWEGKNSRPTASFHVASPPLRASICDLLDRHDIAYMTPNTQQGRNIVVAQRSALVALYRLLYPTGCADTFLLRKRRRFEDYLAVDLGLPAPPGTYVLRGVRDWQSVAPYAGSIDRAVPLREAARILELSYNALDARSRGGRFPVRRQGRRRFVDVAEVRHYLPLTARGWYPVDG